MKSYLITYDLNRSGQNYTILVEKLKSFERYQHCMDSIWLVRTTDSAVQIRNFLKPCIDQNDELLIVELNSEAAWIGLGKRCVEWIKENL